jgi:hypothetical protein
MLAGGALRWSGIVLIAWTTVGLDGMAWSLDRGCALRCTPREEAPSGAMVVSSAGSAKFMRILIRKIARWIDDSDDFCSVYMRFSLGVG